MDPRDLADAHTTETTQSLIDADTRYLRNISTSQVLSAGLKNQQTLLNKLAGLAITNGLVGDADLDSFKENVQLNKDLVNSITLQTHYSSKDDEGLQAFTDPEGLICPLYEAGTPPLF